MNGLSDQCSSLTATIVSAPHEILGLTDFVCKLVGEPGMLAPRFFLASVLRRDWKPRVVVVSQGPRIIGLLYCKERKVAGLPTRVAFADDTLGATVVALPAETEAVIRCALGALLKHMVALRVLVGSDRLATVQKESTRAAADFHFRRTTHHATLELPGTYEQFVSQLGPSTRHNIRRYRRKSERTGNQFVSNLTFESFCAAAKSLLPKDTHASSKSDLERCLAMIAAMPSRLLIALRRKDGECISVAGGWYAGGRAVLALQLNDRSCSRESLSLVLRSYLIELLTNQRIAELVFRRGTSAPLDGYTAYREEFIAYLDSRRYSWRLVRRGCASVMGIVPGTIGRLLKWIVPADERRLSKARGLERA